MLIAAFMLTGLLLLVLPVLLLLLVLAAMSRHQKAATGELELKGAQAFVETTLEPEGTVLIKGEMWLARSRTGATIPRGSRVRVVGARGHLLQVEQAE